MKILLLAIRGAWLYELTLGVMLWRMLASDGSVFYGPDRYLFTNCMVAALIVIIVFELKRNIRKIKKYGSI